MTLPRYPRERIAGRLRLISVSQGYRILWRHHLQTPLGSLPSRSRFCDGTQYAVLYAASVFQTAFLETVVRDQFVQVAHRAVLAREIVARGWIRIATRPGEPLNLLDLTGSGSVEIGAPTDATRARNQAAGQALGRTIYHEHADVDGFAYASRLTGDVCYGIFDRAVFKLVVVEIGGLSEHPKLPELLDRHHIELQED
jgi:RES domain